MVMYTRKDYTDKVVTHDQYYDQFVTPSVIELVRLAIGTKRIKHSNIDCNFNDIPLREWDDLHIRIMALTKHLLKEADPCWNCLGNSVCIAKQAAKHIKQGSKANV